MLLPRAKPELVALEETFTEKCGKAMRESPSENDLQTKNGG
jgi:hypothetical protein